MPAKLCWSDQCDLVQPAVIFDTFFSEFNCSFDHKIRYYYADWLQVDIF